MGFEKISSLHDDVLTPKTTHDAGLGEYDKYPERFDASEKSVLERMSQFGIDIDEVEDVFEKKVGELEWEEYLKVMAEAIKARYDVIVASVFDQYMLPSKENPEDERRISEMFDLVRHYESMGAKFGVNIIKEGKDFKEHGNMLLGMEAGAHLIRSLDDAKKMAESGIRLFGLQYGKDTSVATNKDGLTELGREVVGYLLESNLIVDLAHAGYRTRQDVILMANDFDKGNLISYTHGSIEEDLSEEWKGKAGERLLKKEEVTQIIKMGGIIGLGVTKPFFDDTRKVAERIDSIAQLDKGIERVAIGTDFGGVPPVFMNDINNPDDFKKLGDILSEGFNMSDDNISKVLRHNAKRWIKRAIN